MSNPIIHITMATVTAPCPHCGHLFDDTSDAIVNACNRNKSGIAKRTCKGCKVLVGLSYDYKGLVAFSLEGDSGTIRLKKGKWYQITKTSDGKVYIDGKEQTKAELEAHAKTLREWNK